MKNKETKKMYSLRIYKEQIEYLRNVSNKNFTTVTQYILDLINKDMKNS
jgi:predicted DNA-binding protein